MFRDYDTIRLITELRRIGYMTNLYINIRVVDYLKTLDTIFFLRKTYAFEDILI